ncbi:MAG: hypothetical protein V3U27_22100, partial [Candidatus Tectomicrobia bacterium]
MTLIEDTKGEAAQELRSQITQLKHERTELEEKLMRLHQELEGQQTVWEEERIRLRQELEEQQTVWASQEKEQVRLRRLVGDLQAKIAIYLLEDRRVREVARLQTSYEQ